MKDLGGLMKQAQALQEKLQQAQAEIAALEITGRAGAGLVEITLNGAGEVRVVKIDPSLADPAEIEVLEDLIKAAFADAKRQLDEASRAKMADAAGPFAGMMPPGFKSPF